MERKMNNFDLYFLLVSTLGGIGILSIPRRAAEGAGVDGVLSTILAGIITIPMLFLAFKLAQKYQNKTILESSELLVGKYLTKIVVIIFLFHFIITLAVQIRLIGETIKLILLYNTPTEVIIITFLLVCAVAVNYGIVSTAKICSNYSPLILFFLGIILVLSLKYANFEELYPMFSNSFGRIMKTAFLESFDYLGFGIILFIMPLVLNPKSILKVGMSALGTIALVYTLVVTISFAEFKVISDQYVIQPTATLSKAISISGFVAERVDIIFIVFWIMAAFTSITTRWFIVSYSFSKIVPQKNYMVFTILSIPLVYTLSLIPQNASEMYKSTQTITYETWFVIFPLLVILYILSFIRKRGESKNASS